MHSAIRLIVNEVASIKSKEKLRVVQLLMKSVFNSHFFHEEYYFSLKTNYRPKFLHIGLKFWETLATSLIASEES